MKILLASNNEHKHRELGRLFSHHEILLPAQTGISFSHEETGTSYQENAYGKACTLFSLVQEAGLRDYCVLADDSGLSLPVLDGAPGIYSARYGSALKEGGEELSAEERNDYLLSQLAGRKDRSAFYVCCMVLIIETSRFFMVQETWHGVITEEPAGVGGFGYDPVFFLPELGVTAAELSEEEKNRRSHRGKAAVMIGRLLDIA